MWQKPVKKTVYTLNINNNYEPDICALTYPLIEQYAHKICAEFHVIAERKFPDWPVVYEKLQIYDLAREQGNDWSIYIDSDTLVHPDFFDPTDHLGKDTVAHGCQDMAGNRFRYDRFFQRDGRHIGSGNWFAVASDWCVELWKPLDDLTLEGAVAHIHPTAAERRSNLFKPEHLIDDYVLSRNIAKYGLKFTTVKKLCEDLGFQGQFLWHDYSKTSEMKLAAMKRVLKQWDLPS